MSYPLYIPGSLISFYNQTHPSPTSFMSKNQYLGVYLVDLQHMESHMN